MPYRRRFAKRRPARRPAYRRRFARKTKLVKKLKRTNQQLNIKQHIPGSHVITPPQLVPTTPATKLQFALSNLPRYNEFRAMFDKYKINGVALKFTLEDSLRAGTGANLQLVYRRDTDGNSVTDTTTVDTMKSSGNCKVINLNANRLSHSIFLKPKYLTPIYRGAAATFGYNNGSRGWLDTNSPDILHYGLEYGWTNFSQTLPSDAETLNVSIQLTYYVSLKGIIATQAPGASVQTLNLHVDPVTGNPNQAQIDSLQAQIDQLMDAHDSDNDHDPSGNVSHPDAAYY